MKREPIADFKARGPSVSAPAQGREHRQQLAGGAPASAGAAHAAYAFGNVAVYPPAGQLAIQAKLTVGPVDDAYEREADHVASQVVSGLNAAPVQRQREPEDEEEIVQAKPVIRVVQRQPVPDEETQTLQPMRTIQRRVDGSGEADPTLEAAIQQQRGGGQALPDATRHSMEQAIGADFSRVRVHSDAQADRLNRSIQARAFTTGQDIFMRQGEYRPQARSGQELLAHELTHVVQQLGAVQPRTQVPPAPHQVRMGQTSNASSIQREFEQAKKGKFKQVNARQKREVIELLEKIDDIEALRRDAGTIVKTDNLRLDMQGASNNGESLNLQIQVGKDSLAGIHLFHAATSLADVKAALLASLEDQHFYNVT